MKWEVDDVENQGNKSKLYSVILTLNQCKMVLNACGRTLFLLMLSLITILDVV